MNYQLIQKLVQCNNDQRLQLDFENPVLDYKVARTLSKSLLKVLKVSSQNSDVNNNLRLSVLENIRRLCQIESGNHIKIDENVTELLQETYGSYINDFSNNTADETEKLLDAFLVRQLKGSESDICINKSINPEILQALNNLDDNGAHFKILLNDFVHWNVSNTKNFNVLRNIWNNCSLKEIPDIIVDDISMKMKSEIERILLEKCTECLENKNINLENSFTTDASLVHLVKTAAISPNCFQTCASILNFLFIESNFDNQLQDFISTFLSYIRIHCKLITISNLYSNSLRNIVLLLDINIEEMSTSNKANYVDVVMPELRALNTKSESELMLVLSHFPVWFDIYFENNGK